LHELLLVSSRVTIEGIEVGDVGSTLAKTNAHEPPEEGVGLVDHAHLEEGIQRERRIAQPGEAVIPVALSADLLWKAGRGGGDNGSPSASRSSA